ncbi:MAG: dihydrolipoyl dehydrogenase [Candidatus Omnitrophica bacterium]|nr:dihydrolipoyl dehydrogenase [Candidatus Omnitrophota bacterium]
MTDIKTEIAVVGSGPGGYTAAFYAADRGKRVVLIESSDRLGGVCLNHGCIPSKAFLHASHLIREARESGFRGIDFGSPKIDLEKMRAWKDSILHKLGSGIRELAKKRDVEIMHGRGCFENSKTLRVDTAGGKKFVHFEKAIIATGSKPALPSDFDLGGGCIMTSTQALECKEVPNSLLIVGAGYIGMELGTVYAALGSQIVVAEVLENILTGADPDLALYVMKSAQTNFKEIRLNTHVAGITAESGKIKVTFEAGDASRTEELFDRVLVSVGRTPNTEDLGLEHTKVQKDEKGFIQVNEAKQTSDPEIYAVGDAAGGMLLAHKAAKEARIAVDSIAGVKSNPEKIVIPAVVFTDPEVAWCGLTESEARKRGIDVVVSRFSWAASGRALTMDRPDGLTKLVLDPKTERILGMGVAGYGAAELIGEGVLAVQKNMTARDLADAVHPHPTLSETISECAEAFYGFSASAYPRRRHQ